MALPGIMMLLWHICRIWRRQRQRAGNPLAVPASRDEISNRLPNDYTVTNNNALFLVWDSGTTTAFTWLILPVVICLSQIVDHGLAVRYRQDVEFVQAVRMVAALAFVPVNDVINACNILGGKELCLYMSSKAAPRPHPVYGAINERIVNVVRDYANHRIFT